MNKARNSLKKTKPCDFCKKERVIWKNIDGKCACQSCAKAQAAKEKKGKTTPKTVRKPAKKISKLKQELDIIFSMYIRLRDSDNDGFCSCVTCGERHYWRGSKMQNGHFMSRTHMSTRFHEQNCSAQCVSCNVYKSGLQYKHGKELDKKWGEGTAEAMEQLSNETVKLSREWYEEQIAHYREQVKLLKEQKGISD